ncbi:MAG TPA: hypothetical protein PKN66_09970, partial [Thermodesulfovibrio thiophilus]|nr:hypothetical protein [Thermodesulfovibrio thiophilus]
RLDVSMNEDGTLKSNVIELTGLGAEIINARGTKPTLDQRLDVSMNEDGTLKSNVSAYQSQWILPSLTFTYVNATTFQVNGDQRDIYTATRRLKINLTSSVAYSEVVSSSYNSGQNKTTVTIADAVLTSNLVSIEHSIISPIDANGAVTKQMLNISETFAKLYYETGSSSQFTTSNDTTYNICSITVPPSPVVPPRGYWYVLAYLSEWVFGGNNTAAGSQEWHFSVVRQSDNHEFNIGYLHNYKSGAGDGVVGARGMSYLGNLNINQSETYVLQLSQGGGDYNITVWQNGFTFYIILI